MQSWTYAFICLSKHQPEHLFKKQKMKKTLISVKLEDAHQIKMKSEKVWYIYK